MTDQSQFVAAVLDPAQPEPDGLRDPAGRPAGKRFDVYRNNVVSSLIGALRDGFPAIHSLLGAEYFTAIAGLFVRAHPPQDPRLMHYGTEFPEFLVDFAPLAHLPYLTDVARLELAMRASYHAADHRAFGPADLAALPPDLVGDATLALAPSTVMLRSAFPIVGIRAKALGGHQSAPTAQDVLVARLEYDPEPHVLPAGAFAFLTALHDGQTLGAAATQANDSAPDFDLSATLSLALGLRILTERPLP